MKFVSDGSINKAGFAVNFFKGRRCSIGGVRGAGSPAQPVVPSQRWTSVPVPITAAASSVASTPWAATNAPATPATSWRPTNAAARVSPPRFATPPHNPRSIPHPGDVMGTGYLPPCSRLRRVPHQAQRLHHQPGVAQGVPPQQKLHLAAGGPHPVPYLPAVRLLRDRGQ